VKGVHGLRHTAEKSAKVTTSAPSPTPAVHTPLDPPVTFADVAGIDEVRQELEEIVQFLRDPERYDRPLSGSRGRRFSVCLQLPISYVLACLQ
jgi:SpoVK/Ycf46/Vps4 family AAA+-type ATPase